jgi:hypothetical protein
VRFDPSEPYTAAYAASDTPSLLFCTADGSLCSTQPARAAAAVGAKQAAGAGAGVAVLVQEAGSIDSFDVEPQLGRDLLAVTDQESVLLCCRPLGV